MVRTKNLQNFVAIDIETTGVDPESDEIIELGAVRVRKGGIRGRFEHLVSPSQPIPPAITRLTGITETECEKEPPLSSILPEFRHFLDEDPVVAHNVSFDLAFLNRGIEAHGFKPIQNEVFDTLTLSRVVLPRLKNHQFSTLLHYFAIPSHTIHRAAGDAEGTAKLFLAMIEYIGHFELDTLQSLLGLTPPTSPLRRFFLSGIQTAPLRRIGGKKDESGFFLDYVNIEGKGSRRRRKKPINLDPESIAERFGPQGELGKILPHYEMRPQQIHMAREISQAFNDAEILMAEAGTGIGKSLAYLVPAVQWALQNGERVILSTKTKNLQEQLFYSDIPLLQRTCEDSFKSVLLKGRSNYLCLNKWYRVLAEGDLKEEERTEILPLVTWVKETKSGDISENTGFKLFQSGGLWNRICAESTFCLGQKCKYKDRCFYHKVRSAAQTAHLVVTNHALLFSDVLMEHAVLDTYSCLILDEAHTVGRVAAQYFGCTFSLWRIRSFLNRLYLKERVELGLLVSLRNRMGAVTGAISETVSKRIQKACERIDSIRSGSHHFFTNLAGDVFHKARGKGGRYRTKLRYGMENQLLSQDSSANLLHVLGKLEDELSRLYVGLSELPEDSFADQAELTQEIHGRMIECQAMISDLSFLLVADDEAYVYWVELPLQQDDIDIRLFTAPLEIGELMKHHFYDDLRTIVFTSGTLAVNGRFDYVMNRLGLDPEKTVQFKTDSPFDFDSQALVCVPSFLPSPKDPSFQREMSQRVEEIAVDIRRGTLTLFTSYDMLTSTYESVRETLESEGILVLAQGVNGSRSRMMAHFTEEKSSILMGTESFWEGVDLPGNALEVLILTKLPFAVPTEPMVEAQMEALTRQGLDPFQHFSLPEAVIKFRQGFGRLIRSRADRGIAIICDTRVLTTKYGHFFLNSLPTKPFVFSDQDGLLAEIKQWL